MKTVLFVFAIAAILIILILVQIHTYVRHAYTNRIITPQQASELNADCILVLGARVWDNGSLAPCWRIVCFKALGLYKAGASDDC